MPHIETLAPEKAHRASQIVYEEFARRMDFPAPPNFILTQGHSPSVARGTWEAVRNVLVSGDLPRWTKEMVFVAISKDRNCLYCTAAHLACCRMLGVNPDTLSQLISNIRGLSDTRLRDMILFAVKCARDPQSLAEEDYALLRTHGLKKSEILELIAMSALAVYANILADATQMDSDEMFSTV